MLSSFVSNLIKPLRQVSNTEVKMAKNPTDQPVSFDSPPIVPANDRKWTEIQFT